MNHYTWLDKNFWTFLARMDELSNKYSNGGIIAAHGDKCYSYRQGWEDCGIPFEHGVAIYLLSYIHPWSNEVRYTKNGWKAPMEWVIENYKTFKKFLPKV